MMQFNVNESHGSCTKRCWPFLLCKEMWAFLLCKEMWAFSSLQRDVNLSSLQRDVGLSSLQRAVGLSSLQRDVCLFFFAKRCGPFLLRTLMVSSYAHSAISFKLMTVKILSPCLKKNRPVHAYKRFIFRSTLPPQKIIKDRDTLGFQRRSRFSTVCPC